MQFNFEVLGTAYTRHSAIDNAFLFKRERYKVLSNVVLVCHLPIRTTQPLDFVHSKLFLTLH
jgi:hypothetical protein